MSEQLKWINRYSDTDDFDRFDRWARLAFAGEVLICWINKIKIEEKGGHHKIVFSVHLHLPVNRWSDNPHPHYTAYSFEEAKEWTEKRWEEFKEWMKQFEQ